MVKETLNSQEHQGKLAPLQREGGEKGRKDKMGVKKEDSNQEYKNRKNEFIQKYILKVEIIGYKK